MGKPFNKALLYDDNCPLCKAYTKAFVQTGFLRNENRMAFSEISSSRFDIDWTKARHEIPLIDLDTREVLYGLDALVNILKQKCACIGWLMSIKPLYWFFKKLYKLISYNRRVIVANTNIATCGIDCKPDFNFKYRFLFILLMLIAASITTSVAVVIKPLLVYGALLLGIAAFLLFVRLRVVSSALDIASQISIIGFEGGCLLLIIAFLQNPFTGAGLTVFAIIIIKQAMLRFYFLQKVA